MVGFSLFGSQSIYGTRPFIPILCSCGICNKKCYFISFYLFSCLGFSISISRSSNSNSSKAVAVEQSTEMPPIARSFGLLTTTIQCDKFHFQREKDINKHKRETRLSQHAKHAGTHHIFWVRTQVSNVLCAYTNGNEKTQQERRRKRTSSSRHRRRKKINHCHHHQHHEFFHNIRHILMILLFIDILSEPGWHSPYRIKSIFVFRIEIFWLFLLSLSRFLGCVKLANDKGKWQTRNVSSSPLSS